MKALWIRIDAHKIDSVEIARLADALSIDVVLAFGHYVALGGAVAEHTDDGVIANVPDSAIERWARWTGKQRGAFAQAVRDVFQNEIGEYDDWPDTMGELVKRRARDRNRKNGGNDVEDPDLFHGNSTEIPPDFHSISRATERYGTERNGTVRSASSSNTENSNTRSGDLHRDASRARDRAAPPASAGTATADLPHEASSFLDAFYPADDRRRKDVERQLRATLNGGAKLDKKTRIRAGSSERLALKCGEVLEEGVRERDRAIVVLLKKLGDSSDGSAPGAIAAAADHDEQQRDDRSTNADLRNAERWLLDRPNIARELDRQLDVDGFTGDNPITMQGRAMCRRTLVLGAWREAGAPEAVHV